MAEAPIPFPTGGDESNNKDEIDNKQNKTLLPACADGNITIKEVNWTSCSMDTLIQHCKERRLSYTGRSSDLVERLIRFEVTNLLTTVDAKKYDPFIDPSGVIWLKELTVVRTKILELLDKVEAAVKKYVKKRLTYISSRFENRLTQAFRKYQNDVAILNLSEVLCSQELMQKADSAEAKYNNDKAELDAMNPAIESYVTAEKGVNKTWYDGKKNIVSNSMTRTSEEINSVGKLKANKDVTTIKGLEVHQSATVRANSAAKREEKKNKKVITAGTYQVSLGELSGSRKVTNNPLSSRSSKATATDRSAFTAGSDNEEAGELEFGESNSPGNNSDSGDSLFIPKKKLTYAKNHIQAKNALQAEHSLPAIPAARPESSSLVNSNSHNEDMTPPNAAETKPKKAELKEHAALSMTLNKSKVGYTFDNSAPAKASTNAQKRGPIEMAPHAKRRTAGTNTAIKDVQEDGEITGSDKGDTGREKAVFNFPSTSTLPMLDPIPHFGQSAEMGHKSMANSREPALKPSWKPMRFKDTNTFYKSFGFEK